MATRLQTILILGLLLSPGSATAHRLDEFLQATFIEVGTNQISLSLSLTPGVDVAKQVIPQIDGNLDGSLSPQEIASYAERVRTELSLTVDSRSQRLVLAGFEFPDVSEMKDGVGVISLQFTAITTNLSAGTHRLRFLNGHQTNISVYLANALVPESKSITIGRQVRDFRQTTLEFEFTVAPGTTTAGLPTNSPPIGSASSKPKLKSARLPNNVTPSP